MGEAVLSATCPSAPGAALAAREATPPAARQPRPFDRVRQSVRARHDSWRTEKAYIARTRRYIIFHGKRRPSPMGAAGMTQYLSALATEGL